MNIIIVLFYVVFFIAGASYAQAAEHERNGIQFDMQGDTRYSQYNFTDIKNPYSGIDAWGELKSSYWIDGNKSFAPFVSAILSGTTEDEFWWQKNTQLNIGLQWYPVGYFNAKNRADKYSIYNGLRFFSMFSHRYFYGKPERSTTENNDFQAGIDYYFDNLVGETVDKYYSVFAWTNAGYRHTNFSSDNYSAFLWSGNIKIGPKITWSENVVIPYLAADWTCVPKYEERWSENFLRIGIGVKWYPFLTTQTDQTIFLNDILKRINVYIEFPQNVAWLGDTPGYNVEETDFKIGISFSTSGYLNQDKTKH